MTLLLIMEAIFGLVSVVFAFLAAKAYAGGKLASAIMLIALGQILMSVGHMVMAWDSYANTNTFAMLFGKSLGPVLFLIVVAISLGASLLGFYKLWKIAK